MLGALSEIYRYRSMIFSLVKRDLRGRYKGSVLGFLWNFILPLMQILVYIMVFTIVFRQNIEHYYVYLTVGLIPWTLFADSISCGSGSIVDNSQLVSKIYFPRSIIPISIILSKFVTFLISMAIVLGLIAACGHPFSIWAALTVPIAVLILLIFTTGLSLLLSAANVYMRDVQYLVSVMLMIFIWLTPIMYVRKFIDNELYQLMLDFNPMTYLINLFQDALYWATVPAISTFLMSAGIALVTLIIGIFVFNRTAPDFAEVL